MTSYKLISLDETVVFPGMPVTLSVDSGTDERILLLPKRGREDAKVGVVAEVTERVKLPSARLTSLNSYERFTVTPGRGRRPMPTPASSRSPE